MPPRLGGRRRNARPHCPWHAARAFILVSAAALLAGCAAMPARQNAPPLFDEAIIEREHVFEAIEVERCFVAQRELPPPEGEPWFAVLDGPSRVLVVAPHATKATRNNAVRHADGGTGALAVMLNHLAGATAIYTTYLSPSDPNYYDDNAFKAEVKRLVEEKRPRLVLDLHASHAYRPYDVDFGTMQGRSLLGQRRYLKQLSDHLARQGLANFSQDYFAASENQTVTKWVSGLGIPAMQVEINMTCLLSDYQVTAEADAHPSSRDYLKAHRFAQLLQGLVTFIQSVDRGA